GSDVAEPEHRGAVGDHADEVSADGVLEGEVLVRGDGEARLGDSGTVGEGEVTSGGDGLGRDHLDLSAPSRRVVIERLLLESAPVLAVERRGHARRCTTHGTRSTRAIG